MSLRSLLALITAALIAVPTAVSAITLTITLEGVPLTAPDLSNPLQNPVQTQHPGVFAGLGNCVSFAAPNQCVSSDPPETNSMLNGTWRDWGYGLLMDQIILLSTSFQVNVTGSNVVLPPQTAQAFWFVVGYTGAGAAGTDPSTGFDYLIDLVRSITVSDGLGFTETQTLHQSATLNVGYFADTLTIDDSAAVSFDLASLGLGTLMISLDGHAAMVEGDPDLPVNVGITAVPIPSTLALLGLGLAGFAGRRRLSA